MRLFALVLVILAFAVSNLQAQLRMLTSEPNTQESLARVIVTNDRSVLNTDCTNIVQAARKIFGAPFVDCTALGGYYRQLKEVPCPAGKMRQAQLLPDGGIDLLQEKQLLPQETCLYDSKAARWVVSLWSGNLLVGDRLPASLAIAQESDRPIGGEVVDVTEEEPILESARREAEKIDVTYKFPELLRVKLEGDPPRQVLQEVPASEKKSRSFWSRHQKWLIGGAVAGTSAALICGVILDEGCFAFRSTQTQTVNIVFE
ncbi:MAG: hypothetical protein Q8P21_00305 [bacterium]|nr:hypothetical protein [bacterium]